MRIAGALLALVAGVACSESTDAPDDSISFRFDSYTCAGSSQVDLFVDGVKVGSPTLAAGETSTPFAVAAGAHAVSATAVESGSEWPDAQVTVEGPTVHVLLCAAILQLEKFTGTIRNRLEDPIIVISTGFTDTIAALSSKDRKFLADSIFTFAPVPRRYDDGTVIPDDGLGGREILPKSGVRDVIPFDSLGNDYFTFSLTNNSAQSQSVAVLSGGSMRCLLNLPATTGTYHFGYFRLKSGVEVRAYAGDDCIGTYVAWGLSQLAKRDSRSGHIALEVTPP
jgi:hypothetical protein